MLFDSLPVIWVYRSGSVCKRSVISLPNVILNCLSVAIWHLLLSIHIKCNLSVIRFFSILLQEVGHVGQGWFSHWASHPKTQNEVKRIVQSPKAEDTLLQKSQQWPALATVWHWFVIFWRTTLLAALQKYSKVHIKPPGSGDNSGGLSTKEVYRFALPIWTSPRTWTLCLGGTEMGLFLFSLTG